MSALFIIGTKHGILAEVSVKTPAKVKPGGYDSETKRFMDIAGGGRPCGDIADSRKIFT